MLFKVVRSGPIARRAVHDPMTRGDPGDAIASAVALAGCGLGAGGTGRVALPVTADFGAAARSARRARAKVPGRETVMRMLERRQGRHALRRRLRPVDRRAAGGGVARDWFYYVNGVEAARAPPAPSSTAATTSGGTATTGARPTRCRPSSARSPSRSRRLGGKRLPAVIECAATRGTACKPCQRRVRRPASVASRLLALLADRSRCAWWSAPGRRLAPDRRGRAARAGPRRERRLRALRGRRPTSSAARRRGAWSRRSAPARAWSRRPLPRPAADLVRHRHRRRRRRGGGAGVRRRTLDDHFAVAVSRPSAVPIPLP